jgi:hypothetical protein
VVAHAGLHIDATYSGGTIARTIQRNGYRIVVYQPVKPRMLERTGPFVQIVFEPADALPAQVSDEIDLDGDGRPDVRVSFNVPADANAKMHGDVTALNGGYISLTNVSDESFSRMVVRAGNKIVVRMPLNEGNGAVRVAPAAIAGRARTSRRRRVDCLRRACR